MNFSPTHMGIPIAKSCKENLFIFHYSVVYYRNSLCQNHHKCVSHDRNFLCFKILSWVLSPLFCYDIYTSQLFSTSQFFVVVHLFYRRLDVWLNLRDLDIAHDKLSCKYQSVILKMTLIVHNKLKVIEVIYL